MFSINSIVATTTPDEMSSTERRSIQLAHIPEHGFQYEKPLDMDRESYLQYVKDKTGRDDWPKTLIDAGKPEFKTFPANYSKKGRRYTLNRLTATNDLELVEDATSPSDYWTKVLQLHPPRLTAGSPEKVLKYLADIKPHLEVSETTPYQLLNSILYDIERARVDCHYDVQKLKKCIDLPDLALVESVRIYGSSQDGFGTFPAQISFRIKLCGLDWYPSGSQVLPDFWTDYFQALNAGTFNQGSSSPPAKKDTKRARARQFNASNAQKAKSDKRLSSSIVDDDDMDEDICTQAQEPREVAVEKTPPVPQHTLNTTTFSPSSLSFLPVKRPTAQSPFLDDDDGFDQDYLVPRTKKARLSVGGKERKSLTTSQPTGSASDYAVPSPQRSMFSGNARAGYMGNNDSRAVSTMQDFIAKESAKLKADLTAEMNRVHQDSQARHAELRTFVEDVMERSCANATRILMDGVKDHLNTALDDVKKHVNTVLTGVKGHMDAATTQRKTEIHGKSIAEQLPPHRQRSTSGSKPKRGVASEVPPFL